MNKIEKLFVTLANAFPLWVLAGALLALWEPATATWFRPNWIPVFLGIIMLSMGLTLEIADFRRILEMPRPVFVGLFMHYLVMPGLGWLLSTCFGLPIDYVIGLVLVAAAPSGTASNVICFIARANVALSVTVTTCSTIMAVVLTPLLTTLLVWSISREMTGVAIHVNTMGLLADTLQVVILPVTAGTLANHYFHRWIRRVSPYVPFLAVLSIVFIVDFILAARKDAILATGMTLIAAITCLHFFGFLLGYLLSRLLKLGEIDSRTVSIEVGLQNSGLATELARSNFPAYALATVPGAISALIQCILACILAEMCILSDGRRGKRDTGRAE